MKRSLTLAAALMTAPLVLEAQQWTPEQIEVIESLKGCWDTWMVSMRADDPSVWIDQCTDGDYTFWWAAEGAPNNPETLRRNFEWIKGTDLGWSDIRPLTVKVFGDVAVMHFYGYWWAKTSDGKTLTEELRTEVFRKLNGRWVLAAGHSTPRTPADAEPYRQ